MKEVFYLVAFVFICSSCGGSNPCNGAKSVAEEAVNKKLKYPDEANFEKLSKDCSKEGDTYVVMGLVTAKNAFGVRTKYVYKVEMTFIGDDYFMYHNWNIKRVRLEKYAGS